MKCKYCNLECRTVCNNTMCGCCIIKSAYSCEPSEYWTNCTKCNDIMCGSCIIKYAYSCESCLGLFCKDDVQHKLEVRTEPDPDIIRLICFCDDLCKQDFYSVEYITSGRLEHEKKYSKVLQEITNTHR
jgi:hypothetical protein